MDEVTEDADDLLDVFDRELELLAALYTRVDTCNAAAGRRRASERTQVRRHSTQKRRQREEKQQISAGV